MQRPDRLRLQHMLEAAREAQVFVAAKSREDLDADRMLQFALVRAIEIFGEAASQVSGGELITTQHLPLEGGHQGCAIASSMPISISTSTSCGTRQ